MDYVISFLLIPMYLERVTIPLCTNEILPSTQSTPEETPEEEEDTKSESMQDIILSLEELKKLFEKQNVDLEEIKKMISSMKDCSKVEQKNIVIDIEQHVNVNLPVIFFTKYIQPLLNEDEKHYLRDKTNKKQYMSIVTNIYRHAIKNDTDKVKYSLIDLEKNPFLNHHHNHTYIEKCRKELTRLTG